MNGLGAVHVAPVSLLTLALLSSIAVGTTVAFLSWRERPAPGSTPLVAILAAQSWWSISLIFQLRATTLHEKLLWVNLSWVGVVVIPVAWLLFSLEYTGHDQYVRPRYVALLSVIPLATVLVALTSGFHELLYVQSHLVEQHGVLRVEQTPGTWYWVVAAYTYLLGLAGVFPILRLVTSNATKFRGQSVALLVGSLVPWATNALHLANLLPTGGLDPTPIAFAVSGVAYLGALTRFRLLGTSPSPTTHARRMVFDRMHEGALVVDSHDYVVDVNDRGAAILGIDPNATLGTPAADVIPDYDRLPAAGRQHNHLTIGDGLAERSYDVTVTEISNVRDDVIGHVLTFHDVSQHVREQERLKVLNRALRHNIRTEMNLVYGHLDQFAGDDAVATMVEEGAHRIEGVVGKVREAIEVLETERTEGAPRPLDSLLDSTLTDVRNEYPDVTFQYDGPAERASVAGVLEHVFVNAVENAVEHNTNDDPRVHVAAEVSGDRVSVRISDNGPGIDEYERGALAEGEETPLRHGSGIGLWVIKWGTNAAGGDVSLAENDPTGTVMTIEVPNLEGESIEDGPKRR